MQQFSSKIQEKIFSKDIFNFEEIALDLFNFQYKHHILYQQFTDYLKINTKKVETVEQIPFLPIEFFKTHRVLLNNAPVQKIMESSGTTGQTTSKHYVTDLNIYKTAFRNGFSEFYGNIKEWTILALLPSYLERDTSSLVYMVNDWIENSENTNSGFYLNNLKDLKDKIISIKAEKSTSKILLIGVTFALLDFAEQFPMDLSDITIMETGGMKGRRKEQTREEVHTILKQAFQVNTIHSEYGMTELLSQGYSNGNGIFKNTKTIKILKRDIYNPLKVSTTTGRGALNVIDLANIYSCAFIATQDVVNIISNSEFEVLGRTDNADIRGCNLMLNW